MTAAWGSLWGGFSIHSLLFTSLHAQGALWLCLWSWEALVCVCGRGLCVLIPMHWLGLRCLSWLSHFRSLLVWRRHCLAERCWMLSRTQSNVSWLAPGSASQKRGVLSKRTGFIFCSCCQPQSLSCLEHMDPFVRGSLESELAQSLGCIALVI